MERTGNLPSGVRIFENGISANLQDYSAEHPEVRYILYSGDDTDNAVVWMVSMTSNSSDVDALISKAKTNRGFYQMINKESLVTERIGGFVL